MQLEPNLNKSITSHVLKTNNDEKYPHRHCGVWYFRAARHKKLHRQTKQMKEWKNPMQRIPAKTRSTGMESIVASFLVPTVKAFKLPSPLKKDLTFTIKTKYLGKSDSVYQTCWQIHLE